MSVMGMEAYRTNGRSPLARWLLPALIVSLLLHVLLWYALRNWQMPFTDVRNLPEREEPARFQLEAVDVDTQPQQPLLSEQKSPASSPQALDVPREQIGLEQAPGETLEPGLSSEVLNSILSEKPGTFSEENALLSSTAGSLAVESAADTVRREILSDKPEIEAPSVLPPSGRTEDNIPGGVPQRGEGSKVDGTGFSNLDDLLAQTGPLQPETAPILMPTDLLFDYDSHALREEAVSSLRKLGTLIQKNPHAHFLIEGHTDSFGTPEYNLELSRLRAESVRAWLVQEMSIDPARIRTRGYGSSRLIAPATGSIEEQAINRRVEIVIHVPKTNSSP